MFEDYLRDTCDIYHLADTTMDAGYGITAQTVKDWQAEPGETGVACHFHVNNGSLQWVQRDPDTDLDGQIKLSLPYGTDIRKNDLVVSGTSESVEPGIRFRASAPRTIHGNHHIVVTLYQEDGLKGAI